MKIKKYTGFLLLLGILFIAGCAKDNLKAPTLLISGNVVGGGGPVGVRSTGVAFEIWQHGYQLFTKIPLPIDENGKFSALLYAGDYLFVRSKGAGPWVDASDSIAVSVHDNMTFDIPVDPYFVVSNVSFVKNGTNVDATFTVKSVNTTKALELVRLYIGPNIIIDQNNNSANVQALAAAVAVGQPIKLTVAIPASIATQDYIFARVGVKTIGIAELMYSTPQKVALK